MNNRLIPINSVLMQDHMHGKIAWVLFSSPVDIISTENVDDVEACMLKVEELLKKGFYVAGYLAYEASKGLNSSLETHPCCEYPLLWFGVYSEFSNFDIDSLREEEFSLTEWVPNISSEEYGKSIEEVKQQIYSGNTYQVNFTFRLRSQFTGSPIGLANHLFKAQSSEYCAYINMGDRHICSASPELFFDYSDGRVTSKPMKGTVKRGLTMDDDSQRKNWLHHSIKNRSENVMIVDMIRNDMSRLPDASDVIVEQLFSVERYPTVFQMTSTVAAKTKSPAVEIVRQMFPCASITGAPKVNTMKIIKHLEPDPRGIYTGSIGYFSPDNKAQFNVAIRTVALDTQSGKAEYGVGGGIIWDSQPQDEYNECKLKAAILTYKDPGFSLLETLLWEPVVGFAFLDEHLARLQDAAVYFGYAYEDEKIRQKLNTLMENEWESNKVRLLLNKEGVPEVKKMPVNSILGSTICIAREKVNTLDQFVFHKTTNRAIYDNALAKHPDFDDVLLVNEDGHITESCIGNLVVQRDGKLVTPTLNGGLLNGIYRKILLQDGVITEGNISAESLHCNQNIYLINSVRGWLALKPKDAGRHFLIDRELGFQPPTIVLETGVAGMANEA